MPARNIARRVSPATPARPGDQRPECRQVVEQQVGRVRREQRCAAARRSRPRPPSPRRRARRRCRARCRPPRRSARAARRSVRPRAPPRRTASALRSGASSPNAPNAKRSQSPNAPSLMRAISRTLPVSSAGTQPGSDSHARDHVRGARQQPAARRRHEAAHVRDDRLPERDALAVAVDGDAVMAQRVGHDQRIGAARHGHVREVVLDAEALGERGGNGEPPRALGQEQRAVHVEEPDQRAIVHASRERTRRRHALPARACRLRDSALAARPSERLSEVAGHASSAIEWQLTPLIALGSPLCARFVRLLPALALARGAVLLTRRRRQPAPGAHRARRPRHARARPRGRARRGGRARGRERGRARVARRRRHAGRARRQRHGGGRAIRACTPRSARAPRSRARGAATAKRVWSAARGDGRFRIEALPPAGSGSLGGFWTLAEVKMKLDDLVASDATGRGRRPHRHARLLGAGPPGVGARARHDRRGHRHAPGRVLQRAHARARARRHAGGVQLRGRPARALPGGSRSRSTCSRTAASTSCPW